MEGTGGGGSTAALPPGGGAASNGGPHHQQQQWGATQFYGEMPHHGGQQQNQQQQQQQQNQLHQQLLQQQQLMQLAAAAAASGQNPQGQQLVGQQLGSMIPSSQAPTLNMMLQGMSQGMAGPHPGTLPSPSTSAAAAAAGHAGFLLLQQPGIPGHPQGGRDISPGSTPGLGHQPPPSATPPTMIDDRGWLQQQQQQNLFFGGPRHLMDKTLEEQMKNPDLFAMDSGYRPQQEHPGHHMLNQMHMSDIALARSLNQYPYAPAQSPPTMFHQQQPMPHPMPPRPRPEGGQDPSPTFLNEELSGSNFKNNINNAGGVKKEDLVVIDSWTGGPATVNAISDEADKFYMRAGSSEDKEPTGWGAAPPPSNPNGWGQPPPKIGNWQQPPPNVGHPPPPAANNMFGAPPPGADRGRGIYDRRGGGPRGGGGRGGYNSDRGRDGVRGVGRGAMLRGRGRGGPRPSAMEREQEKQDGKKNAIAETIAMMNKMKMEDKERRDANMRFEEERRERNREMGITEEASLLPEEQQHVVDDHHNRGRRGRDHPRGGRGLISQRGHRGARGGRGASMGINPNLMPPIFGGQPNPAMAAPGMLFPPPGVPGFPGMEQLLLGGGAPIPGFHPGNYPGSQPFFHPLAGAPPGQFANQFRFPGQVGRGMGRGFMANNRGGLSQGRGGRGGRGGGRGGGIHQRPSEHQLANKPPDEDKLDKEDVVKAEAEPSSSPQQQPADLSPSSTIEAPIEAVVPENHETPDQPENGEKADVEAASDEPPKNVISGQGKAKGQLALSASQTSSPRKSAAGRKKKTDDLNLKDRLTQQLVAGQAECMVCLDKIRPTNATWHCDGECFQVFHIHCIKKWSKTARTEDQGGWRCPGCQFVRRSAPRDYRCFCGKVVDPPYERGRDTPHSCGEVCGKPLKASNQLECQHKCVELCHPGPCPPCTANIMQTCPCGKTSLSGRCGTTPICENICNRQLNCQVHQCQKKCHKGVCEPCEVKVTQHCACSQPSLREVSCDGNVEDTFSCEKICQKQLDCSNHNCTKICHKGPCQDCPKSPLLIKTCHCGKKPLEEGSRISCLDEIPSCGQVCEKVLLCGPAGDNHICQEICHEGECPKCPLTSKVLCRCGFMDKEMECAKLNSRADDARCEKQCSKKRQCLRHKCGQKCCILIDHECPLVCGRLLSCGQHRCNEPCHRGNCPSCPNVSFDELSCYCGTKILYPPIACGVKPPYCEEVCIRPHSCSHPVMHHCHTDERCPPCTALTEKWCHGHHELRKSVACHIEGISCGKPCDKALPCGRHRCIKPCHPGDCESACRQPCQEIRLSCSHPCNAPCHEPPCPSSNACNEKVKMVCDCGNLTSLTICSNNTGLHSSLLAAQIRDLNNGNSTNIVMNGKKNKIECNEECAKLERNRRVALALQIENPDVSTKLAAPKYSDFLKDMVKKDPSFATMVHEKLSDLVKLAKESKQKSRSYSFEYMNRDKRQFVHELSDHFGVDSESFDAEPKRNVVATAVKDRAWLPSQSVVDVVFGIRKAPAPVSIAPSQPTFPTLQSLAKSNTATDEAAKPQPVAVIDYFDYED